MLKISKKIWIMYSHKISFGQILTSEKFQFIVQVANANHIQQVIRKQTRNSQKHLKQLLAADC